ncbi:MAG TPA: hypothetical protein VFT43_09935, partial [Candidatus Polarisedimenticolia bacterium]|nr:hypothetical protein [Candidatus Polarisedimenticolia bacterium]
MTVISALRQGLTEATGRFRLTLCLYALNLVAAAALALPMAFLVDDTLGRSVALDGFDSLFRFEALADFLRSQKVGFGANVRILAVGALLYALFSTLLTGGVLDILKSPPRSPFLPRFLGGSGRLALRFLRLLPYLAVALIALRGISLGLDRLLVALFDRSAHEVAAFWAMRGKQALMLLLLLLLAAIFDLARILTALEDRRHMIGALRTATGFVARHLGSIAFLVSALLGLGLLLFVPYLLLAREVLPASSILALVCLQQAVMLLRHWFRVAGFAALLTFYRGKTGGAGPAAGGPVSPLPAAAGVTLALAVLAAGVALPARAEGLAASVDHGPGAAAAATGPAAAGQSAGSPAPLSRRVVSYRIEASLDPALRLVRGRETIVYRNDSRRPMPDLKLHLYPNAFSNTRTTYMQGIAWDDRLAARRLERMTQEGAWGFMQV